MKSEQSIEHINCDVKSRQLLEQVLQAEDEPGPPPSCCWRDSSPLSRLSLTRLMTIASLYVCVCVCHNILIVLLLAYLATPVTDTTDKRHQSYSARSLI